MPPAPSGNSERGHRRKKGFRFGRLPGIDKSMKQENFAQQFVNDPNVKPLVKSYALGHNDALEWAAKWVTGSADANGNEAVREFAANMAMTFRASLMKRAKQHRPKEKDEYAGRCRECGSRDHKAANCDMESEW